MGILLGRREVNSILTLSYLFLTTGCSAMNTELELLDAVNLLEKKTVLNVDEFEKLFSCELRDIESVNMLPMLLGESSEGNDYKEFGANSSAAYPQISEIKVTTRIIGNEDVITFYSLLLYSGKEIDMRQIVAKWGDHYKVLVNRPTFPVGERCVAAYEFSDHYLYFGYSDCSQQNSVVKIGFKKN